MLDFNEVFWHADKRGKTHGKRAKIRGKLQILKLFLQTRCIVDRTHTDTARCGRQFQNEDALRCGRGLFTHL